MPESPASLSNQPTASATAADRFLDEPLHQNLVPNRRVPAWLLSCIFHTLIFVVILLALRTVNRGAGNVETRTAGIVLVDMSSETTEYLSEGEVLAAETQASAASNPPPVAAESQLPPNLPGMETSESALTGTGDQINAMPGADALIETESNNNFEIGGRVTTEVFGLKGTGSRFVYVFDRSTSMEGYNARPLIAAKQQLLKSIDSLGKVHQFQIIFYNDQTKPFRPPGQEAHMFFADEKIKQAAHRFVNSIRGDGGTDHLKALRFALRLNPDVVFLLTDAEGGFTPAELNMVAEINRSGSVINTIEFGDRRGADRSLEKLSRENGGQYVFKNINSLRIDK